MKVFQVAAALGLAGISVLQQVGSASGLTFTVVNSAGSGTISTSYVGQSFTPSIQGTGTGTAPSSGGAYLNSFSFGAVNSASGIASGMLYVFSSAYTGTPNNLASSNPLGVSAPASGGQYNFSGNGVLLSNVTSPYYVYSDTLQSIGGSSSSTYSGGNLFFTFSGTSNFASQSTFDTNFTATLTPAGATGVPFEFSPIQGIVMGVPLFTGLRILKKRKALKVK